MGHWRSTSPSWLLLAFGGQDSTISLKKSVIWFTLFLGVLYFALVGLMMNIFFYQERFQDLSLLVNWSD